MQPTRAPSTAGAGAAAAPDAPLVLGGRAVGGSAACLVVAEVAQAHDGSLGTAHAFIDAVAEAGADAVKFQTHIAHAESTPAEPWRVAFSPQDASRYEYWKRMEFSEEQWRGLKRHAQERGLLFLSAPFSIEAFELLRRVGVPAWKVASGELTNTPLLERIADTGLPVLLSSGMSTLAELDAAVQRLRGRGAPLAVFQCTSMYPTPPEHVGLNVLAALRERYRCPVGLSDHSGELVAGLAAAALGADLLEVHVTFSKQMFGPDVVASLTLDDLRRLVDGVRFLDRARGAPVDKDALAATLAPVRRAFMRSVVARVDLPAGTVLQPEHLVAKKPGTGVPAARLPELVGRRLTEPLRADEPVPAALLEAR
ncbi:MAG: N-acetylneuraminate synthase family protein [Phycisphaerae bacterium]